MANTYTSLKLSYDNAYRFIEGFSPSNEDFDEIKYVFLGKSTPYSNESVPDSIVDSVADEKSVWDNMFAGKRVTGNDVQLVVSRYNWTANTRYRQYDDRVDVEDLLAVGNSKPMYIITSENNVYKCLCNNVSANSTVEPTGDFSSSNGFISTADNYLWKYMYSVKPSNKFFTPEWIPAPTSILEQEYETDETNIVEGALAKIVVTNRGTGYFESNNIVALPFANSISTISLQNMANIATNMFISGNGILSGTFITNVDLVANSISLSTQTIDSGGGANNKLTSATRAIVDGDGRNDYLTEVRLSNNQVDKITVTSIGTGYSRGTVLIYGTGTGAAARVVLPPKFGHGYNPAKELGSKSVIISSKIGDVDSTEGGVISTDTSFRQYGLLSAPYKYGSNDKITLAEANNVVSQTYDITVVAGLAYTLGEFVYQGSSNTNPTFSGFVHAQETNVVRLTNVVGTPVLGSLLKGDSSGSSRAIVSEGFPKFQPYTGDILFVQNAIKTQRTDGQAENIKFVVKF